VCAGNPLGLCALRLILAPALGYAQLYVLLELLQQKQCLFVERLKTLALAMGCPLQRVRRPILATEDLMEVAGPLERHRQDVGGCSGFGNALQRADAHVVFQIRTKSQRWRKKEGVHRDGLGRRMRRTVRVLSNCAQCTGFLLACVLLECCPVF